ncbi:MAG: FAD-binding protein [Thermoprotei archaeon]
MPRIIVLVKVVPNISQLRFDPIKKTLIREGVKNVVNPHDERAVEEAVRIKEKRGGSVSVLCMGPPQVEDVLRELYAFGVDYVYLLTDRAFAGADTLATSTTLAHMCGKLGYDLVIGGKYSVDAETSQLIPEVSQLLGTSLVTNATKLDFTSDSTLIVEREYDEGYETFEVSLPATLSVSEKINRPRIPKPSDRELAKQRSVTRVGAAELSADISIFGSTGSPTSVKSVYDASYARKPAIFDATNSETAISEALEALESLLREKPNVSQTQQEGGGDPNKRVWSVFLEGEAETQTAYEVLSRLSLLGYTSEGLIVGEAPEDLLHTACRYGAKNLLVVRVKDSSHSSKALAEGVVHAIKSEQPYAVFFPSTVKGREVAGRVAAALRLGLTGDAVDLKPTTGGELVQVKPAFGGNIMAEIVSRTIPQLATVRPGVFEPRELGSGECKPKWLDYELNTPEAIRLVAYRPAGLASDLYRARFVICAGYGVGSPEGFKEVAEFAKSVKAAVGATRKIVDLGWAPPHIQVGLTGKSINPDLYVAIGVSGATNHMIGVRRARVILAVNRDPRASIFSSCDIGIVADYKYALSGLREGLERIGRSLSAT